jgi:hypothetical protein
MKKNSCLIIPVVAMLFIMSCTKGFEKKNQDPYAITAIDPGLLFTGAERNMNIGSWDGEQTIVQQYINAYNAGATAGFQFNLDVDGYSNDRWGAYTGIIKPLVQIISIIKDDPAKKNLYDMVRIWKAFAFMTIVDTYGDVPYSEAGKAYLEAKVYPKYDKMADIYADLYNELKTASADLSPTGDYVKSDLFFGGGTATPAATAAQIAHWKKIGYSLMLRLGMRYSKIDAAKAANIAQEAFAGGVILSNSDNVVVTQYNGTTPNNFSNLQRNISPYFYYLAEPFVTQLKSTADPRLKYIGASYANPTTVSSTATRDTTTANQYGFPIGYDAVSFLTAPGSRGAKGGGLNYTQLNYQVMLSSVAPALFITNAQTQLLLAEAKFRGWITSTTTAQQYYEAGVRAAMDDWSYFPGTFSPAVSNTEKDNYLLGAGVAYNKTDALMLINTQYWICSITNGPEGFANWRRSGFPALLRNKYNDDLVPDGGFVRRMSYPDDEAASNSDNYKIAAASMGGDKITKRVFWDKP